MKRKNLFSRQFIVLFCLGFLFFNYPLLSIFSQRATLYGIPVLYAFIFVAWLLFIAGIALIVERKGR